MTCQSQSLMRVTVPFYLRVVYKFSNEFFNEIPFVCRYSFPKEKTWQLFPLELSLSVSTLGKFSILMANLINARNIKYSSLFSAFKTSSSFLPKQIKSGNSFHVVPFLRTGRCFSLPRVYRQNERGFLTSQSEVVSKSCYR